MIDNIQKVQEDLAKTLTKIRDDNNANHAELVQVVEYALESVRYPAIPTGTLTPKGEAELKTKDEKKPATPTSSTPTMFAAPTK